MTKIIYSDFNCGEIVNSDILNVALSQLSPTNKYKPITYLGKSEDNKYYYYLVLRENEEIGSAIVKVTIYKLNDEVPPAIISMDCVLRGVKEED